MADTQQAVPEQQQSQQFDDSQQFDSQQNYSQFTDVILNSVPGGPDSIRAIVDAYHDEAERSLETSRRHTEETLRTARRVSDIWALSLMQHQISSTAARQAVPAVIEYFKRNPQVLKQVLKTQ